MGRFSTSCMVSGLPIGYGTKVRLIALMGVPYESHVACDPQCWWSPTHPGIKARYNDYGSVEDVEEVFLANSFFEDLSRRALKHEKEKIVHDVDVYPGMPADQWLEALYLHKVFFTFDDIDQEPQVVPVRQAMIREDVWQILLGMAPDSGFFTLGFDNILGYDRTQSKLERSIKSLSSLTETIKEDGFANLDQLTEILDSLKPSPIEPYQVELLRVQCAMSRLSRVWVPGHTTGPQFPEWGIQTQYLEAISQLAKQQLRKEEQAELEDDG